MQINNEAERSNNFSGKYPLWLVVRHFLDASLSRELFASVVNVVSRGKLSLDGLVEESFVIADGPVSTWTVRPRNQNTVLAKYFVRLLKTWIWQGDDSPGVYNADQADEYSDAIADIEMAFRLSSVDFNSLGDFLEVADRKLIDVSVYIDAAVALRDAIKDHCELNIRELSERLFTSAGRPLGSLLVKHLGDLCVDEDRHDLALQIYEIASDSLDTVEGGEWQSLITTMKAVIAQSLATSAGMLGGPAVAAGLLEELVSNTKPHSIAWSIVAMNATPDLMAANSYVQPFAFADVRGATLSNPQMIDQHDLQNALTNSANGKYRDAHRFFWAVLRRQIALGSGWYSSVTKAHYGKSIIEDLVAQIDKDRNVSSFLMGVRLLIESQSVDMIGRIDWTESLVNNYIDENLLIEVLKITERARGRVSQRQQVVIHLFSKWLSVASVDNSDAARRMIVFIARMAIENRRAFNSLENVGGDALKLLKVLAKERPEFRSLEAFIISRAVLANLEAEDVFSMQEAIEVAYLYSGDFDEIILHELVQNVIQKTQNVAQESGLWAMARTAMVFLDSEPVIALAKKNTEFGRNVVAELIRLALQISSDHDVIMYLLRSLPPKLLQGQVDEQRLDEVVSLIRKQALQTNSTGASGAIRALLVAPAAAKVAGFADAIEGLKRILISASTDHPSLSFAEAFQALIHLGNRRAEFSKALNLTDGELTMILEPLFKPLLEMWRGVTERPEIFNGFSIPLKTVPNPTVVHNWAFASLAFAHSLGRLNELADAMEEAAKHALLKKSISVAKAIRSDTDGANLLDAHTIRSDTKEAFYAVLGQRLVALNEMQTDQQEAIDALLEQCMRYGPEGIDAGLFVVARRLKANFDPSAKLAQGYKERLLANRELRISLAPLFERVSAPDGLVRHDG